MAKRHPELFVERIDGTKSSYGIRQNFDITNAAYRYYSERIIRKMMEHFARNPAIIGYQVDNETHNYGATNDNYFRGFVDYLKNKYKTTDTLNTLWGLNYWGITLNGWDIFPTRRSATNPSYKLEWDRYGIKAVADFITWQATIMEEYKRPDQFITHDFMGWLTSNDQLAACQKLDMPSLNVYHGTQNEATGDDVMWSDDFYRSVMKNNFLITETNAQSIGWGSKGQYPPFDGQGRLFVYSHLAGGANMVEYWHWHSNHYGQETYWKGVLGHDLEPNRFYKEVSQTAHELQKIGQKLVNLKIKNKTAILYSHDSDFGLSYMPFKDIASDWIEFIIPETAKSLAMYNDPFFGNYPAITENKYGKGSFIYEGCLITDEIQSKIIHNKGIELGLIIDNQLTYPIVMKNGINDQGKTIRYFLNYSDKEQAFVYYYTKGTDLPSDKTFKNGDHLSLKPWDILVVEE